MIARSLSFFIKLRKRILPRVGQLDRMRGRWYESHGGIVGTAKDVLSLARATSNATNHPILSCMKDDHANAYDCNRVSPFNVLSHACTVWHPTIV